MSTDTLFTFEAGSISSSVICNKDLNGDKREEMIPEDKGTSRSVNDSSIDGYVMRIVPGLLAWSKKNFQISF